MAALSSIYCFKWPVYVTFTSTCFWNWSCNVYQHLRYAWPVSVGTLTMGHECFPTIQVTPQWFQFPLGGCGFRYAGHEKPWFIFDTNIHFNFNERALISSNTSMSSRPLTYNGQNSRHHQVLRVFLYVPTHHAHGNILCRQSRLQLFFWNLEAESRYFSFSFTESRYRATVGSDQ